jgi:hypothetical protein
MSICRRSSRSQHGSICSAPRARAARRASPPRAPADMPEGPPCGSGIKAAVAYLHGCQMVGFKRLTELREGMFGLTISQGAISNMLARMGKPFGAATEQIAATVRGSEVMASDETSARVKGKTHWQWTFGCATAVYHVIAPTRGKCVPTDFLAGAQRFGHTSLTRRNVGGSPTPGNHAAETALVGCPGRIRTGLRRFRTSLLASFAS